MWKQWKRKCHLKHNKRKIIRKLITINFNERKSTIVENKREFSRVIGIILRKGKSTRIIDKTVINKQRRRWKRERAAITNFIRALSN